MKNQIVKVKEQFLKIQRMRGMKIHINSLKFIKKKKFSNMEIFNERYGII